VIIGASGSTPRPIGAAIIVSPTHVDGTLGGGDLEAAVIRDARSLIQTRADRFWTRISQDYPLGPILDASNGTCRVLIELFGPHEVHALEKRSGPIALRPVGNGTPIEWLGSDAGLSMESRHVAAAAILSGRFDGLTAKDDQGAPWWIERASALDPKLYIFAGGPVTAALRRVIPGLPFDTIWIDPAEAAEGCALAAPAAFHVVLTGSHALDYAVCRTVLAAGAPAYLGLMGSPKKRTRFEARLREDGLPAERIAHLRCPIGLASVPGKEPAVIAVAIAAELVAELRGGRR
jgi:xanthine dehydrogenase accessory factor